MAKHRRFDMIVFSQKAWGTIDAYLGRSSTNEVAIGIIFKDKSVGYYTSDGVTETSRFDVRRAGKIHFEDITTSAISEEDKAMLEGVLPYPMNEHVDFSIPYLQGFTAKKRDIEREALSGEVRGKMENYSKDLINDTARGYTALLSETADLNILSSHWEYTLMPIWILTYKRKNKNYTYAMNGATGKIYGELPVSFLKLGFFSAFIALIAGLLSFLIGWGIV